MFLSFCLLHIFIKLLEKQFIEIYFFSVSFLPVLFFVVCMLCSNSFIHLSSHSFFCCGVFAELPGCFFLSCSWRSVVYILSTLILLDFLPAFTWTHLFSSQLCSLRPGCLIFCLLFCSLRELWGRVESGSVVEMVSCFVRIAELCGLSLRC